MPETFLTIEQAARTLQIAPYTLRSWIKAGKLHAIKPGKEWRVPSSSLEVLARGDAADEDARDAADARRVLAETAPDEFISWDTAKEALDAAHEREAA